VRSRSTKLSVSTKAITIGSQRLLTAKGLAIAHREQRTADQQAGRKCAGRRGCRPTAADLRLACGPVAVAA